MLRLRYLVCVPLFVGSTLASDWPHWRGPDRNGISPETGWSSAGAAEAVWSKNVGIGYSSPSIANGRLYTRGFFEDSGNDVTFCLDAATGEELWRHESPSKLWNNMHGGGTLTTPTVDGDTVFVLTRMGPLFALDAKTGEVRWERRLKYELGIAVDPFGLPSSPLVLGDDLILNVGPTLTLDKATGATRWMTKNYGYSYSTPAPFAFEDKDLLAVFNGFGLVILDRKEGEELASLEWKSQYNVNCATPIVIDEKIFISTGYNEKGGALLEFTGDALEPIWSSKRMNNRMNGCVLVDDYLYGFDDAVLRCLDIDGEELWNERGLGKGTVIASDDRLIVLSEDGELIVAPASSVDFEPTYRVSVLEGGKCWTTPVLANGLIYCRNSTGTLVARDHRARE